MINHNEEASIMQGEELDASGGIKLSFNIARRFVMIAPLEAQKRMREYVYGC